MSRTLLVAGVVALALSGCTQIGGDAPSPTTAAEIAGTWSGSLTENSGSDFSVKVTIDNSLTLGQQAADADYKGIGGPGGCSGTWVYNGEQDGSWKFTETITSGAGGTCDGTGTVTLTPAQDGLLQYLWVDGKDSSNGFLGPS